MSITFNSDSGTHLIDGYDISRASCLMGPSDIDTCATACQYVCYLIKQICITILRVFNLICGDGIWYTNEVARNVVQNYFNSPNRNQYAHELEYRIQEIYTNLRERTHGQGTWADTISPTAQTQLNHRNPRAHREGRSLNASRLGEASYNEQYLPENPVLESPKDFFGAEIPKPVITRPSREEFDHLSLAQKVDSLMMIGETGNLSLKHIALGLSRNGERNFERIQDVLITSKIEYENSEYQIPEEIDPHSTPDLQQAYRDLFKQQCEIEFPRLFNPIDISDDFIITDIECSQEEQDVDFSAAKDPYDLFKSAVLKAIDILGLGARLRTVDVPTLRDHDLTIACRLAILLLLKQANLRTDDCHGPYIMFNGERTTKAYYQPAIVFYAPAGRDMEVQAFYDTDILSSTNVGCDPVGARVYIHHLQSRGEFDQFENDYSHYEDFLPDTIQGKLCLLLNSMASQIKNRYGTKILSQLICDLRIGTEEARVLDIKTSNFSEYIDQGYTPYQLFKYATAWVSQKLGEKGLLTESDFGNENADLIKTLLFSIAAFQIFLRARCSSDFEVHLTNTVAIPCGQFYSYQPQEDNPRNLKAALHPIPSELCGNGTIDNESTDPIKLVHLLNKLTKQEIHVLEQSLLAPTLERLIHQKGLSNTNVASEAREMLSSMPIRRQELIREARDEIARISKHLTQTYYTCMASDILNLIDLPENVPPQLIFSQQQVPSPIPSITQSVQMQYFPTLTNQNFVIKSLPSTPASPRIKVRWEDFSLRDYHNKLSKRNEAIIATQYILGPNNAPTGHCMYGALAIKIFGSVAQSFIDKYVWILRKGAAKYIEQHKEKFRLHFANISGNLNTMMDTGRLNELLDNRLTSYCNKIINRQNPEWGTALEMEAISDLLGSPIFIYFPDRIMRIINGDIQPSAVIGAQYNSAPIKLNFDGIHYRPLYEII